MDIFKELLYACWQQDFEKLSDTNLVYAIYLSVFIILFLENGLLPAAFLPGDSLLILLGVLIAKGLLNFFLALVLLTIAASLGSWMSYLQGKWLENNRAVKSWLAYLPKQHHQRAQRMFHRHGLSALLVGRFVAFVRTLLPTIVGLSGLSNLRFQFYNWISSFLWIFILMRTGSTISKTLVFQHYEKKLMPCLILMPLALLTIGLVSLLVALWHRKNLTNSDKEL